MSNTKADGNGHLPPPPEGYEKFVQVLEGLDPLANAFSTPDVANGIKILAVPGNDVSELPMRADFPDRQYLVACARHLAKCRKFNDKEGEKELLFIVAGLCGIQGKRADMLVSAIIGERQRKIWQSGESFASKFKKASGIGGVEDGQQ